MTLDGARRVVMDVDRYSSTWTIMQSLPNRQLQCGFHTETALVGLQVYQEPEKLKSIKVGGMRVFLTTLENILSCTRRTRKFL